MSRGKGGQGDSAAQHDAPVSPGCARMLGETASFWSRDRNLGSRGRQDDALRRHRFVGGSRADVGHARGFHRLGQRRPAVVLLRPLTKKPVTLPAISDLRGPAKPRTHPMKLDRTSILPSPWRAVCSVAFCSPITRPTRRYPTVTNDRLEHPDAGDWLMYRRTYDGSGFSPLKQITPSNIRRLTLAWSVSTDLLGAHERRRSSITAGCSSRRLQNNIIAFDAKTGTQLWRYVRKIPGRPVPAPSD